MAEKELNLRANDRDQEAENLKYARQKLVLVINKVDLIASKRKILSLKDELENYVHFEKIFIVSAETGFGIEDVS